MGLQLLPSLFMIKIGAMKLYVLLFFITLSGKINIHAQQISERPYVKVEGESNTTFETLSIGFG